MIRTFRAVASPVPDSSNPNTSVVAEFGTNSVTSMCLDAVVVPRMPWSNPLSRASIVPALSTRSHTDADVETSRVSISAEMRTRRPASVSTDILEAAVPEPLTVADVERNDSVAPAAVVGEPSAVMT